MIGKPKYKHKDKVSFKIFDKIYNGEIHIIDKYGVFEDNTDVYYDILVNDTIYKHIKESSING
jgi:hypothetical protein